MSRVLLGYQTVRLDTSPFEVRTGRSALELFAREAGYSLGYVFVEENVNRPLSALARLIKCARETSAAAVAVPRASDLGLLPHVQREMRDRVKRETGLPVRVLRVIA